MYVNKVYSNHLKLVLLNNIHLLQYFLGVTLLALIPDIPEIVNGIQFALQNNINLRYVRKIINMLRTYDAYNCITCCVRVRILGTIDNCL